MALVLDIDLASKLAAPILTAIAGYVGRKLRPKVRLISFFGHVGAFQLAPTEASNNAPTGVHTHSVIVQNLGTEPAHNVRFIHGLLPDNVTLYPSVTKVISRNPDGSGEILLPVLSPKEQVTVSYLYFPPVNVGQINQLTKCDECIAKVLYALPMPQPPLWLRGVVWFLMSAGALLIFYFLAKAALYFLV